MYPKFMNPIVLGAGMVALSSLITSDDFRLKVLFYCSIIFIIVGFIDLTYVGLKIDEDLSYMHGIYWCGIGLLIVSMTLLQEAGFIRQLAVLLATFFLGYATFGATMLRWLVGRKAEE